MASSGLCWLFYRHAFSRRPALPEQVPTRQRKHQQGELQQRWITGSAFCEEVVVQGNCSRDEIDQRESVSQAGLAIRVPPEQAQGESDQAVKGSASEHRSLIVILAEPLVLISSLQ